MVLTSAGAKSKGGLTFSCADDAEPEEEHEEEGEEGEEEEQTGQD